MSQQEKILEILSDGETHSTKEIADKTRIGYPPRRIHELRRKGFVIEGVKGKFWEEYRLISNPVFPTIQERVPTPKRLAPLSASPLESRKEQAQPAMFELKKAL